MSLTTRRAALAAILAFAALPCAASAPGDTVRLVILHVNDDHGHLLPHRIHGASRGGVARLATLVSRIRSQAHGRVLLLHAGDVTSRGDSLTTLFGGEVNMKLMNRMGFDALTPGNGDYYDGVANLLRLKSMADFPFVEANIRLRGAGRPFFDPYVIKHINGVTVAIVGLGIIHIEHPSSRPLELDDSFNAAVRYGDSLRTRADLTIALTHQGIFEDEHLAESCPSYDLIVGGHTHTVLDTGDLVTRPDSAKALVVQAGEYGEFLGRADVVLVKQGSRFHVVSLRDTLIPVDSTVPDDESADTLIAEYRAKLGRIVCYCGRDLVHSRSGPDTLGELVARAMEEEWGAKIALVNRAAVSGSLRKGPVLFADIRRIYPWANGTVVVSMTGSELSTLLAEPDIVAAGVVARKAHSSAVALVDGKPAKPTGRYRVVTTSAVAARIPGWRPAPAEPARDIAPAIIGVLKKMTGNR